MTVGNLSTSSLQRELTLCHHPEEEEGEDLDKELDHTISSVRGNRTQAGHPPCMWMILLLQRAKKWLLQMGYHQPKGHQRCHRRFLRVVGSQGIVEDEELFTVRTGSLHHLLQKVCWFLY